MRREQLLNASWVFHAQPRIVRSTENRISLTSLWDCFGRLLDSGLQMLCANDAEQRDRFLSGPSFFPLHIVVRSVPDLHIYPLSMRSY